MPVVGRYDHPAYLGPLVSRPDTAKGHLIAMLNPEQIASVRVWLDSPDNKTWVRSGDVSDAAIRTAVAAVATESPGAQAIEQVAAYLASHSGHAEIPMLFGRVWADSALTVLGTALAEDSAPLKEALNQAGVYEPAEGDPDAVTIKISLDLVDRWREARLAALAALRVFLPLDAEISAMVAAEDSRLEQAAEDEEREAEVDDQRREDEELGDREFYLNRVYRSRSPRGDTVHTLDCDLTPPSIKDDFLNSLRVRAVDVSVLVGLCSKCHPEQLLNQRITDPPFTQRRENERIRLREERSTKAAANRSTRPDITHRKVRGALDKAKFLRNDYWHPSGHGFDVVGLSEDHKTATVRWDPSTNLDTTADYRPTPEQFVTDMAEVGYVGGYDPKTNLWTVAQMSPQEKQDYQESKAGHE